MVREGRMRGSVLHLVNTGVAAPQRATVRRRDRVRTEVARENTAAAGFSELDMRAVLALRVAESLEGGRAAILRPERRDRLTRLATRLGLRPFDAALVIAIVQDGVRSGEGAASGAVRGRLRLVRPADLPDATRTGWRWRAAAAVVLALVWLAVLIAWVGR